MIAPGYAQRMARYNAWQNDSVIAAADGLSESARREDRGAFFGSIHATLNHILWADAIWLHRLAGDPPPTAKNIADSLGQFDAWAALTAARAQMDLRLIAWAAGLTSDDLTGDLSWFSAATNREQRRPRAELVIHLFNHQTHHRGQVHAMLTRAGARPAATDLPFQPETA